MRDDLRVFELAMADEAFALSPISARATQPSEADYDAIREAFMETSRGRWFLGEYAKRNRNADTRLVLDAVARMEETLAAQRKPSRDPLLDEALACFRSALGEAKDAAQAALGHLALEENLAPVRKGARVIREIAWRLREIGADSRICDLIDSQVSAIEAAAAKMVPTDLARALSEAFEAIEQRIAAFGADEAEMSDPPSAEAARPDASDEIEPAALPEELAEASAPADAFDADDEAVLDRIALEMAAPDSDAAYEPAMDEIFAGEPSEPHAPPPAASVAPPPPPPTSIAAKEEVALDDIEITFVTASIEVPAEPPALAAPAPASPVRTAPEAATANSLGSSLLASGIVQRPRSSKPDPLAPIRRMSQSEKIAFFS
jgi:hypothetical protein